MTAYERSSLGIQAFIALVTAVYAIFAGFQWHALRETLQVSKDSIELSRQSLMLANRPWVVPGELQTNAPFTPDKPFRVEVHLKNVGSSPALSYYNFIYLLPISIPPHQGKDLPDCPSSEFLPEGSRSVVGPQIIAILSKTITLPPGELATRILNEEGTFMVCGGATYIDVLSLPHHTNYCFMYMAQREALVPCPKGNTAD